jgi:hypothetical protein
MKRWTVLNIRLALGLVLGISVSACAHDPGSYKAITPPQPGILSQYSNVIIEASNDNEVPLTAHDRERLVNKIVKKIQITNRFKEIGPITQAPSKSLTTNVSTPAPKTLSVKVNVTNYDEGNSFLRFLLAGLGQIHINGRVSLIDQETAQQIGEYEVSKTFAWGGAYGLTTKIEDVEDGFADAVANIVLERTE